MPFTYTPSSDRGKVRLLTNDVEAASAVFQDDEIDTFLVLAGASVFLAAALAIETIADNETLASKVLRSQDLTTDGAKVSDALRARAATLRAQHAAAMDDEDAGYFGVVEEPGYSFYRPEHSNGYL